MKSARSVVRLAAVAAALSLVAQSASAQLCNGTTPFSAGKLQLHAGFQTNGGTTLGGGVTYGMDKLFIGGNVQSTSEDGYSAMGFGGGVGYQIQPASQPKMQICPQGSIMIVSEDIDGTDFDGSYNVIRVGAGVGRSVSESSSMGINLFGGAYLARFSGSFDTGFGEADFSDTGVEIDVGAGFVFNNKITVRPMLTISTIEGHDTRIGVWGTLPIGGGTSAQRVR